MLRFRLSLTIAVMAACVLSMPVFAQDANMGIPQVDPGLITPHPDEELPGRDSQMPAVPPEEVKLEVPPQPASNFQDESVQFVVARFEFQGNTVFQQEDFEPIAQSYTGRPITLKDLGKLADEIAGKYRSEGYMTTQVYLPPQSVDDGVVTVAVVEGSIGKIVLSGNKFYRTQIIRNQMQFGPGDLLNIRELENQLNQTNRSQSYRLQAVLSRGEETGETDIGVEVKEAQPWQITPSWDNQGRPFIGMQRYGVEVQNESLLGLGDRLSLRWLGASGTQVGAGSYNVPIHKSGTTLGYGYSFGYVNVDLDSDDPPKIQGFAHNNTLTLSQPLNKSRSLSADVGLNFRNISTFIDDETATKDRIRSLSAGLNFNHYDRWGRTNARLQTDAGFNALGGNRPFWKTSGHINRLVVLPKRNLLILRATGQVSPDALPSAEAFQLGGEYSVRGYTEGLLIGDRGYNLSAEWRWPVPGLRRVSPWLSDRLQGVFFYDMGQAWSDTSNPNFRPSNANNSLLMGAGVGVRARLTHYLSGFVDFGAGFPKHDRIEPNGQPDVRVHFGVQSELLPKDYIARSDHKTIITRTTQQGAMVGPSKPVASKAPVKVAAKPVSKPPLKTAARPGAKNLAKAPLKPGAKPMASARPPVKIVAKGAPAKPGPKPGAKTVAKAPLKPAAKPVAKPIAKAAPPPLKPMPAQPWIEAAKPAASPMSYPRVELTPRRGTPRSGPWIEPISANPAPVRPAPNPLAGLRIESAATSTAFKPPVVTNASQQPAPAPVVKTPARPVAQADAGNQKPSHTSPTRTIVQKETPSANLFEFQVNTLRPAAGKPITTESHVPLGLKR